MNNNSNDLYRSIRVNSWDDARQLGTNLVYCAFRGQGKASWRLETKFERLYKRYQCPDTPGFRESEILETFQRRAHHFVATPPDLTNKLEWLALIQHYGGPTRLLDFTYSFYIAVFFAIENAEDDAAIWGINLGPLTKILSGKLDPTINSQHLSLSHEHYSHYCNLVLGDAVSHQSKESLVVPVEPWRTNERLAIQQGLFIFPVNIEVPFEENLASTIGVASNIFQESQEQDYNPKDNSLDHIGVLKITLPLSIHKAALYDLDAMNINAASLFPGLDGFARSLQVKLAKWDFRPVYESMQRRLNDDGAN